MAAISRSTASIAPVASIASIAARTSAADASRTPVARRIAARWVSEAAVQARKSIPRKKRLASIWRSPVETMVHRR